jgi:dATP pyrophosphohydrolase
MDDKEKYKRPVSVLVVIYSKTGHVLMMKRAFPEDFWQSVTGSLEWGESAEQAAIRELKEETGLEANGLINCQFSQQFEIYSIWRDRYQPGVMHNQEHVFLMPLEDCEEIQFDPREHTETLWVSREEAIQMATSHTNCEAILRWVPDINAKD